MSKMDVVFQVVDKDENPDGYMFFCPGCEHHHKFWVEKPASNGSQWSFNGDRIKPTFRPSLKNTVMGESICHCFVTDGNIQFCKDSTHRLSGQTVPLEPFDA